MNIGVNARVLLKGRMEGVCRYIFETTRRMAVNHPEHDFYLFFDRPYDPSFVFSENVHPVVLPPPTRHPFLWYIWFEWVLPRAFNKYKIDVFYSGDTFLSLHANIPTLLVSHDIAYFHYPKHIPYFHRRFYQIYFPKYHQKASHIVAVSEFTKQDICKAYHLKADKVTVGYNSVPEGFHPLSEDEKVAIRKKYTNGHPYFIYVGSLHPRKNVINLIKAFDQFKQDFQTKHQLVLVGRFAWNNQEFKHLLPTLKFRDDIQLTGHLTSELPSYLGAAEALAYVSVFEGFGIPILEAFASGVPVITSNVSSMPEVSQDAALLVDPLNVSEIATAFYFMTKEDNRQKYIQKGQHRVKDFSWDYTAQHILTQLMNISTKNS